MSNSNTPSNYRNKSAYELREMLLNNTIETDLMDLEEYEKLFGYEIELEEPDVVVLNYCNKGLKQYDKYKEGSQKPPFETILRKYNAQNRKRLVYNTARRVAIFTVVLTITALLAQGVAVALGYNGIIDLGKKLLNIPEKTVENYDDNSIFWSDDSRIYNSMQEMIESESLNILYPDELPNGYEFTDFRITDSGIFLEIVAFKAEPYIYFRVEIGTNITIDDYSHQINNIKYNLFDTPDGYQACWVSDGNYYWIVVSDEATLSEIIKNLKESKVN